VRQRAGSAFAAVALLVVSACGIPRDPEDSFERIQRTGVLRAGITPRPPWTTESGGPEADAVTAFAHSLGARVEWRHGSESELFEALETFELDLAVGGFTADNPWMPKLGMTRPYIDAGGRKHVAVVAPGENRLLFEFDRTIRSLASSIASRTGGKPQS
jgi:polar amino acid transport system substrate-binding protein